MDVPFCSLLSVVLAYDLPGWGRIMLLKRTDADTSINDMEST